MTFEEIFQPGMAPIVGAVITAVVSINTMFLKWLINSFTSLKEELKVQSTSYTKWLSDHENKDQARHEENLYRFEKISVALARLGSTNGSKH
jgi:hypothetical protein